MRIVDFDCPNCGASLNVEEDKTEVYCEYCGSTMPIKLCVDGDTLSDIRKAGYEFEKGRLQAREEFENESSFEFSKQRKTKIIWWVLGWIFIFPLPLTIIISKNDKLKLWQKILIIASSWLIYVLLAYLME